MTSFISKNKLFLKCDGCEKVVKHSKIHNDSKTRLYKIWKGIHSRCSDENSKYYGMKGISFCDEWKDYEKFKEWAMLNGYKDNLTIDRIDFNGNYEPSNCRWATYKEQARNTSRNHYFELNGKIKCAAEWCEELGIKSSTFFQRLKKGLNPFTGARI